MAEHISYFSLANAISIGLRSDEYGGRYSTVAPADSISCRTRALMAGKIVHHDDVTSRQRLDLHLLDERLEHIGVDRAIDRCRATHPLIPQGRDQRGGFPVSVRNPGD